MILNLTGIEMNRIERNELIRALILYIVVSYE